MKTYTAKERFAYLMYNRPPAGRVKTKQMKTLKLEVGKTYRSRNGEEVKITGCDGGYCLPYRGTNGEYYTEGGRQQSSPEESPNDLIEEVPGTRHTFDIPNGVKKVAVSQEGNRIVVEMVPEKEPKPGDVIINDNGSVYILKEVMDYNLHSYYAWLGENGHLSIGCIYKPGPGRPATPEEAQPLWDALEKAGKRWNAKTMEVEEIGPKPGDVMINTLGNVYIFKSAMANGEGHKHFVWLGKCGRLSIGSWCDPGRPATPEEAKPLFDALKKAGKRWNPQTMVVEEIIESTRTREAKVRAVDIPTYYTEEEVLELLHKYEQDIGGSFKVAIIDWFNKNKK